MSIMFLFWSWNITESVQAPTQCQATDQREATLTAALEHEDYFGAKELASLRDLFQARVYLGHNSGLRHPSMSPYIFGTRQGCDIIDLEQTLPLLHQALNITGHIVYRGGMVLFLSRQMQVLPWVERLAREVGEYAHCRSWQRGE
ncbi:30S ribosomal protein s2 [Plakobranchus ocellatus]|uniref:30S ribosomal protein s2 n=1 Tax=Plakobranchus ocellatus TaxID=259542 RepID=A0AAV4AZJ2_9GAST|nr:30S ribosomal protein s2 [Plakobranchus ocellatus]